MRGNILFLLCKTIFTSVFQFTPLHERQLCVAAFCFFQTYFNSRLYMRGNAFQSFHPEEKELFQFTPLHERQQVRHLACVVCRYFNSRLYMRGNFIFFQSSAKSKYFNSRLYMRGNGMGSPEDERGNISIHAST